LLFFVFFILYFKGIILPLQHKKTT
jgi:hypothetical protein